MIITKEQQMIMKENVYLKTDKDRVGIRFTNKVAGTAKNHFNIKLFKKNSHDAIEVKLNKSTLIVDRKATEAGIDSKEKEKFYKKNIDTVAAALQYSKDEINEYFEKENTDAADASQDAISKKFREFESLSSKEKQQYIDDAKKLSKELNESNLMKGLGYIEII